MYIPETPYQDDDTQPNPALSERTTVPNKQTIQRDKRSVWLWLGLVVFATASLLMTLGLTIGRNPAPEVRIEPIEVSLRVAGEQSDISTTALTVENLLAEQNVTLGDNDAVAPDANTPLDEGMIVTVARARTVTLTIDGDTQILLTPLEAPQAILDTQGIILSDTDRVWLDGTSVTEADIAVWPVPVDEIEIQSAYTVTIVDGDTETTVTTIGLTVGDALFDAGITVFLTDTVDPSVETNLTADVTVTIERALLVTINVDDTTIDTRVQGDTVADALSEAGIALVGLDYTIPAETDTVTAEMTINVLRVSESLETTDTTLPYQTVYQADATMNLDSRAIIQAGQAGVERLTERVRFENGLEVAREPISTEVITEIQNEIVSYGTNVVLRNVETPEGTRQYWRVIRAYATSYHPEALGGDSTTSIGETLRFGIIASNPDIIPYRTNLFVPGYGVGMMADTGGARSSPYWVDLGYSDEDWVGWSQYVDVYLLAPVPAEIDYLLPNFRPMRGLPDNG
ncbi:MAG: ubiquitin-like domain-containing protein [Chloroflexota bacterium]